MVSVLADDVTGDGLLDLVVSTMSGNVYCIGTHVSYHPAMAWTSHMNGPSGFTVRDGYHGVWVTPASRAFHEVLGRWITVEFEIVDQRDVGPVEVIAAD